MLRNVLFILKSVFEPSMRAVLLFRLSSVALPLLHVAYYAYRTHDAFVAAALTIAISAQPAYGRNLTGSYRIWVFLLRVAVVVIAGIMATFDRPYDYEKMIHAGWSCWAETLLTAVVFVICDSVAEAHYRNTHGYAQNIGVAVLRGTQTITMQFALDIAAVVQFYVRPSGPSLPRSFNATLYTLNGLSVKEFSRFKDLLCADLPMNPGHYVLEISVCVERTCRVVAHSFITPKHTTRKTAHFTERVLPHASYFPDDEPGTYHGYD